MYPFQSSLSKRLAALAAAVAIGTGLLMAGSAAAAADEVDFGQVTTEMTLGSNAFPCGGLVNGGPTKDFAIASWGSNPGYYGGTNCNPNTDQHSAIGFKPSLQNLTPVEQDFQMAEVKRWNNTQYSPGVPNPKMTGDLTFNLQGRRFPCTWSVTETNDIGGPVPDPVTVTCNGREEMFVSLNDKRYILDLRGFREGTVNADGSITCPTTGPLIGTWLTEERKVTGACLFGRLVGQDKDLVARKSVTPSQAWPGETVTYQVNVTNPNDWARTVEVSDDLSDALASADAVGSPVATIDGQPVAPGPTISGGTLTWKGRVPAQKSVLITYQATVKPGTRGGTFFRNKIAVPDSNCQDGSTDTRCATSVEVLKLRVKKTADRKATWIGETVTYGVDITNAYNKDRPNTVFSDDLSNVLQNAGVVGTPTATVDGVLIAPQPTYNAAGKTLNWGPGTVPAGKSVRLAYQVRVRRLLSGDRIMDNQVTVGGSNCDEGTTDPDCTARVRIAELRITKTAPPSIVFPGQLHRYRITVSNSGAVDFLGTSQVVLYDDMSGVLDDAVYNDDMTQVSGPPGTLTYTPGRGITWRGDLKVGERVDYTYSVTVKRRNFGDMQLYNQVSSQTTVRAPYRSAPVPRDDDGVVPATCWPTPESCATTGDVAYLDTRKSVTPYALQPGEKATYTWKLTNISNVDFTNLPQTAFDPLDEVLKFADYGNDAKVVSGPGSVTFENGRLVWTGGGPSRSQSVIRFTVTVRKNALDGKPTDGSVRVPNTIHSIFNCPDDDPSFPPEPICKASFMIFVGPKPPVPPVPPVIPPVRPILPQTGMGATVPVGAALATLMIGSGLVLRRTRRVHS